MGMPLVAGDMYKHLMQAYRGLQASRLCTSVAELQTFMSSVGTTEHPKAHTRWAGRYQAVCQVVKIYFILSGTSLTGMGIMSHQ